MSAIANKRKLLEAVNALVKVGEPDDTHIEAATQALAQVFTDIIGADVTLTIKVNPKQLAKLIADAAEKL